MIYNIFPKQGNYVGSFLGHCATSNDETYFLQCTHNEDFL